MAIAVLFAAINAYLAPFRAAHRAVAAATRLGGTVITKPAGPQWLRALVGESYCITVDQVDLSYTPATDDDLAVLEPLRALRLLWLGGTQLGNSGLEHLRGLTSLKELHLDSTGVTDDGMVHLTGMKKLTVLSLNSTRVTDAALPKLEGLSNLEMVSVGHTRVTVPAVFELYKKLPNVAVAGGRRATVLNMLCSPYTQDDLRLTDQQNAAIHDLQGEWTTEHARVPYARNSRWEPHRQWEYRSKSTQLQNVFAARANRLLSDAQQRRLAQILLQIEVVRKGAAGVLLQADIAEELTLTDEQRARIEALADAVNPYDPLRMIWEDAERLGQEALALLSEEQSERWKERLGPPYSLYRHDP